MTFEESLTYLEELQRFGMKPGLDRTRELLRRTNRPDWRAGRIIHITGTSGKGSVAAMVAAGLQAAGYRTGLYTSPSVEAFTDRIQINRAPISTERFADLMTQVRPHVEAMAAEGLEVPTEFEVITTAAFLYFDQCQVDWLVLEVGLGGRFDATTAIENPVITCVTNVGLDHTEWLGTTHEQIAWDKAGILKPAVPCVTGTDHPGALHVIRDIAVSNSVVLTEVGPQDYQIEQFGPGGQFVNLLGARGWYKEVKLSLLGHHQAANAAIAARILELAGITEQQIRNGLATVVWPGRFEVMRPTEFGATVLLDGAHNPAKCEALAHSVLDYFPDRPITLLLGALSDKDVTAMIAPLLKIAAQVIVTEPESDRRLSAHALQQSCSALGVQADALPSLALALQEALRRTTASDLVVVTGSFYLVGPVRKILRQRMGQE